MINHGSQDFVVNSGDQIAQLILERIVNEPIVITQELPDSSRGGKGFGSTGTGQIYNIQTKQKNITNYSSPSQDTYGRDDQGGKGINDNNLCYQIPDLCSKDGIRARHAPDPPLTSTSPPPMRPESELIRTPLPTPSESASSTSSSVVLDPGLGLSVKRCKDGWPPASVQPSFPSASDHKTPLKRYIPTLPCTGEGSSDKEEMLTRSGRESGGGGGLLGPTGNGDSCARLHESHTLQRAGDSGLVLHWQRCITRQ